MLSIQTYSPESLRPYVKSFWCLTVPGTMETPYVEDIIPDGHHEIVFNLSSAPARRRTGAGAWSNDPSAYFTGQNTRSYGHQLDPGAVIYAVRFHPHTQHLFYDFPALLSTDKLIPFSDVSPGDALPDCLAESAEATFRNFEKEFLRRVARLEAAESSFLYVDAAVQKIISGQGNVRNEQLEKITGITARHLEKSFLRFVGVSPKQFSNLVRFGHFMSYRKNNPQKSLTECGLDTGFYDQSHLIHLAKRITAKSPKALFPKDNVTEGAINRVFLDF